MSDKPRRNVTELESGEIVEQVFMISQPVLRTTTRGDYYIAAFLSDQTGRVNGRMWQASEAIYQSLPQEGFVWIKGRVDHGGFIKNEDYISFDKIIKRDIGGATEMAKPFGRRPIDWLNLPGAKQFISSLSNVRKSNNWIYTERGQYGGTWMHEDVALYFFIDIPFQKSFPFAAFGVYL